MTYKTDERFNTRISRTLAVRALLLTACFSLTFTACQRVNSPSVREEPQRSSNSRELKGPYNSGIWNSETITKMGVILQEYLGTPYQGTSKYQTGIDCSRFTSEVYRRFDKIKLPRTARDQSKVGEKVQRSKLRYGDLVFFRTNRGGGVSHVGIYVGFDRFVHASSSRGVVIDAFNSKYWSQRFLAARRVLGDNVHKKSN